MIASLRLAALAAAAAFGLMSATAAQAEDAPKTKAKASAKAPAKKAEKAEKAEKTAKASKAAAAKPVVEAPLPDADETQLAAAQRAYQGAYACEFNQTVQIAPHAKHAGYLDVTWKKDVFTMKPVLSPTGALRLEDVKGRALMVQIANKSMLMDTKAGQRLVDECQSAEQRDFAAAAKLAPPVSSLGIDPNKAAAVAAAAPAQPAAPVQAVAPVQTAAPEQAVAPMPAVAPVQGNEPAAQPMLAVDAK
ncbi:hypothetical protein [Azohydromonas caseinilytica]|uniref:Uncharacterized protein n=1 Tax=Azohydromonas caseinilytica TaxID=2728836 RepID=A0A848FC42_9BURK|nr:hypothetical protein [Azohydromonas caseinilytica]NML15531.1 hypothetical protein [Azohydromonas caseinilytica]